MHLQYFQLVFVICVVISDVVFADDHKEVIVRLKEIHSGKAPYRCKGEDRTVTESEISDCDFKIVISDTTGLLKNASLRIQRDLRSSLPIELSDHVNVIHRQSVNTNDRTQIKLNVDVFEYDQTNYIYNPDVLLWSMSYDVNLVNGITDFHNCRDDTSECIEAKVNNASIYDKMGIRLNQDGRYEDLDMIYLSVEITGTSVSVPENVLPQKSSKYSGTIKINLMSVSLWTRQQYYALSIGDNDNILPRSRFIMKGKSSTEYATEAIYSEVFISDSRKIDVEIMIKSDSQKSESNELAGRQGATIRFTIDLEDIDKTHSEQYNSRPIMFQVRGISNVDTGTCPKYRATFAIDSFNIINSSVLTPWIKVTASESGTELTRTFFENHFVKADHSDMKDVDKHLFNKTLSGFATKKNIEICIQVGNDIRSRSANLYHNKPISVKHSPFFEEWIDPAHRHQRIASILGQTCSSYSEDVSTLEECVTTTTRTTKSAVPAISTTTTTTTTTPKATTTTTSASSSTTAFVSTTTEAPATAKADENEVKSGSPTGTIVGVVIMLLLIIALVIGFIYYRKRRNPVVAPVEPKVKGVVVAGSGSGSGIQLDLPPATLDSTTKAPQLKTASKSKLEPLKSTLECEVFKY